MPTHRLIRTAKIEALSDNQSWFRFVVDPGDGGVTSTFAGGEPSTIPRAIVDLTAASSELLGRQVSQTSTFRLRGVTIGFSPKDDSVNNESDSAFMGKCLWYMGTDHARKALQLARAMERHYEADKFDEDSLLLSTENDYSALRVGMSQVGDILYQSTSAITGLDWTLSSIMSAYNTITEQAQKANALFNGRAPSRGGFGWVASQSSGKTPAGNGGWMTPAWFQQDLYHDCLAGLVEVQITGSTMAGGEGTVQDDWHTEITVDWEVTV